MTLDTQDATTLAAVQGIVFDVQRFSVHDGPGLRTNVFLKGCPLRCGWCANPESQNPRPELSLTAGHCITCGQFAVACPASWPHGGGVASAQEQENSSALEQENSFPQRAQLCPTGAMHWVGTLRTAGDVMAEVMRDHAFYGEVGGLTLTGGEPTMQPQLCEALLRLAKDAGLTTAMETCGHTSWVVLERLLPFLDSVLYDFKHVDAVRHREATGLDNELILANLTRLVARHAPVVVRIPLIPGFNADQASLAAMADFLVGLDAPLPPVNLLPYHTLGQAKYGALGRDYPWRDQPRFVGAQAGGQAGEQIEPLRAILTARGLTVRIGG